MTVSKGCSKTGGKAFSLASSISEKPDCAASAVRCRDDTSAGSIRVTGWHVATCSGGKPKGAETWPLDKAVSDGADLPILRRSLLPHLCLLASAKLAISRSPSDDLYPHTFEE